MDDVTKRALHPDSPKTIELIFMFNFIICFQLKRELYRSIECLNVTPPVRIVQSQRDVRAFFDWNQYGMFDMVSSFDLCIELRCLSNNTMYQMMDVQIKSPVRTVQIMGNEKQKHIFQKIY